MRKAALVSLIFLLSVAGNCVQALSLTAQEIKQGQEQIKTVEASIITNGEKTRTKEVKKIEFKMKTLKKTSKQYAFLWEVRKSIINKKVSQVFSLPKTEVRTSVQPIENNQGNDNSNQNISTTSTTPVITKQDTGSFIANPQRQYGNTNGDDKQKLKLSIDELKLGIEKEKGYIATNEVTIQKYETLNAGYSEKINTIKLNYNSIIDKKRKEIDDNFRNGKLALEKLGLNLSDAGVNSLQKTYDENMKVVTGLETERDYNISLYQSLITENNDRIQGLKKLQSDLQENINSSNALVEKYNVIAGN